MPEDEPRLEVTCSSCGKFYRVKRELAGRTAKCNCGAKLVIPPATAPAATSQPLTTDLVLPPEVATPDASDDEYEIEAPIARQVPETIRRAVEQASAPSGRPLGGTIPPSTGSKARTTSNEPLQSGRVLLALIAAVCAMSLASLWAEQSVINSARAYSGPYEASIGSSIWQEEVKSRRAKLERLILIHGYANMVNLALPAIAFFAYLVWLYAAHSRLKIMKVANLRFTPGWAIGYQFVPFWNLIRPYQIVREIWHGSNPGEGVNDCGRGHVRSNWLIRSWWIAALAFGVSGIYLSMVTLEIMKTLPPKPSMKQAIEVTVRTMRIQQAGMLLVIVYNVLLGLVVRSIERRQAARLASLSSAG